GEKRRHEAMEAGHRIELVEAIKKAKEKFSLSHDAKVVSCYEAGRDGFWLHRYLVSLGIENQVVDSSSIETNRRKRRVKTDRIDPATSRPHAGLRSSNPPVVRAHRVAVAIRVPMGSPMRTDACLRT
ncbi:MAG: hypothetical protein ACT4QB_10440, partial [Gammaproteobacteria bacterium]